MAKYTKLHAQELGRSYSSMRCRTYAEYFWFRKKYHPEWTKGNFLEHTTAWVKRDGQTKSCLVVGLVAFWNMLWLPIHSFTSGLSQLTLSQVLLPHTMDMKVFCPLKQHWKEVCKIICMSAWCELNGSIYGSKRSMVFRIRNTNME